MTSRGDLKGQGRSFPAPFEMPIFYYPGESIDQGKKTIDQVGEFGFIRSIMEGATRYSEYVRCSITAGRIYSRQKGAPWPSVPVNAAERPNFIASRR
jgi:hypothetical protein